MNFNVIVDTNALDMHGINITVDKLSFEKRTMYVCTKQRQLIAFQQNGMHILPISLPHTIVARNVERYYVDRKFAEWKVNLLGILSYYSYRTI